MFRAPRQARGMDESAAHAADEAAAAWAVRRETRGGDPAFEAELSAWLAEDPRRAGALLRAEAALSLLNRGRALGSAYKARPTGRFRRRELLAGGGLAAVAAGAGGLAVLLPRSEHYATKLGELRKAPLADGSVAAINTDSEIKVAMTPKLRRVVLTKGEAWFQVAKDARRPFVVEAGPVRVRAVGTAFSVRRREDAAQVLVTEGVVETWVEGQEARRIRLGAGVRAELGADQPPQAVEAEAEITHALAWREGQIALYGQPLAEAAAEFNRYNARKIVIEDPRLARQSVVGQFNANDPEAFARAAATTLGARLVADNSTLLLYPDQKP